jgi:hypothetical protein
MERGDEVIKADDAVMYTKTSATQPKFVCGLESSSVSPPLPEGWGLVTSPYSCARRTGTDYRVPAFR